MQILRWAVLVTASNLDKCMLSVLHYELSELGIPDDFSISINEKE